MYGQLFTTFPLIAKNPGINDTVSYSFSEFSWNAVLRHRFFCSENEYGNSKSVMIIFIRNSIIFFQDYFIDKNLFTLNGFNILHDMDSIYVSHREEPWYHL